MLRRIIAYGLVILIVAVLLSVLGAYLLIRTPPAGYTRPDDFSQARLQDQAARLFVAGAKVANTLNDPSGGTPLDVTFVDEMINGQIRLQPPSRLRKLPPWLANPQVVFDADGIRLMADVDYRGTPAVVSLRLAASATKDGNLQLELTSASAGRLPLTSTLRDLMTDDVDRLLERTAAQDAASARAASSDPARPEAVLLGDHAGLNALRVMHNLLHGQPAVLPTTDHGLFIEALDLSDHCLRIVGRRVEKPNPAN